MKCVSRGPLFFAILGALGVLVCEKKTDAQLTHQENSEKRWGRGPKGEAT